MAEIACRLNVREVLEGRGAGLDDEDTKRRVDRRQATGDDAASSTA